MNKEKDDIEKLDEQINEILNAEKKRQEEDGHEVIIDRKYAYDDVEDVEFPGTNTKRFEKVEDEEASDGDTKRLDQVEDIQEVESSNESISSEKEEKEEEKTEEKKENPKKNRKKKIFIFGGIGCMVLLIIILLCIFVFGKKTSEVNSRDVFSKSEQKRIINSYGDAISGIISVYYEKRDVLLEYEDAVKLVNFDYEVDCKVHEIYEDSSLYLTSCKINGVKTKYSYGEKQEEKEVIIPEGAIKVYVSKKTHVATFDEPKNLEDYDVYGFEIEGAYYDLEFLDAKNSEYVHYMTEKDYNGHIVNYKTGKKAIEDAYYESILPIKVGDDFDYDYAIAGITNPYSGNTQWSIYNITKNLRVVDYQYSDIGAISFYGVSGPVSYVSALEKNKITVVDYHVSSNYDDSYADYGVIDYTNGNMIIPQNYKTMFTSGDYLWATDKNNVGHILDYSGKEYLNHKYDAIYGFVGGKYVLVQDGKNVKLVNLKGTVWYNYGSYSLGNANFGLNYNGGALFQFPNPKYTNDYDYDHDDSCLEFLYDPNTKKGEVKAIYCGGIAKPILYLYPKKTMDVRVSFEHPEYLDTTYPKFTGEWKVTAHPNGDLYNSNGNYYYALYWDEHKVHTVDFSTGFYVEGENAISFLEEKLNYIGLSPKERNEFIMYWLPVLEKNKKSLVYFELTEERESYHPLLISPKPDSMLRVVIHIKKVDRKVEIPKQSLSKFQRKGFVAVEWGGTTY